MSLDPTLAIRILYIAGIANIVFIVLVFFSCRCLSGSKITSWFFQYNWFKKFYRGHCYWWRGFFISVLIHTLLAFYLFGGWPSSNDINVSSDNTIINFQDCAAAGNPVMEIYPRQCRTNDKTFTEDIGNELEKMDLIQINSPRPNQEIKSPLQIVGQARGYWFFEGDFLVKLLKADNNVIATNVAQAQGDWMSEDFVRFEAELEFDSPGGLGRLILVKDNPSGLPENDDQLEVPVIFR